MANVGSDIEAVPQRAAAGALLTRTGIHRVLVCRHVHSLGNALLLTPLIAELGAVFPGAEVEILCSCPAGDALFGTLPNVRGVRLLPRHLATHLPATLGTLRAMRQQRYDLVIDPDPRSRSGRRLARMARARYSLGFSAAGKSGTLTHLVARPADVRHVAMLPVYLLRRALGEDPAARPCPQPGIALGAPELERGRATLARLLARAPAAPGPCIGIFANATGAKLLPQSWWQAFIAALRTHVPGCRIVEILPAFGRSLLDERFPCFYSSDLRKLASLLASLDAYVSSDCGVMHLAWASGVPTVGLFNSMDPAEWGPFGPHMGALPLADAAPETLATRVAALFGRRDAE
ncbi:MAG TPA: glycosyltransferase family 9 protein [Rhodanobacteraceae bacterium]